MARGPVVSVDARGGGMIAPDSNGGPVSFLAAAVVGSVHAGERVQFRARLTVEGVIAYALQAEPRPH